MKKNSMARVSPIVKEAVKEQKLFPGESFDSVLKRLFGIIRPPKQFKFKEVQNG